MSKLRLKKKEIRFYSAILITDSGTSLKRSDAVGCFAAMVPVAVLIKVAPFSGRRKTWLSFFCVSVPVDCSKSWLNLGAVFVLQ